MKHSLTSIINQAFCVWWRQHKQVVGGEATSAGDWVRVLKTNGDVGAPQTEIF